MQPLSADSAPPLLSRVQFGSFVDGAPWDRNAVPALERELGSELEALSWFLPWGEVWPDDNVSYYGASKQILLALDMKGTRFSQFGAHKYDQYLEQCLQAALSYGHDVYIRPWPEMNGDWASYQPTPDGSKANGGTPEQFIDAWQYLVTYFRSRGATNVKWVFSVDASGGDPTTATPVGSIWPGAEYVDVLGIDGYNWGQDDDWGTWRSFTEIFESMYEVLTSLHKTAPVWITEFGSKEPQVDDNSPVDSSHDKGEWFDDAFSLRTFPRLTALIYFHAKKERDWRLDSSPAVLASVRRHLAERLTGQSTPYVTPTTSAQNVTPTTSAQNVTPTTSAQNVTATTSAQNVTATTSAQNVTPTTSAQNVTPTTSAQIFTPASWAQRHRTGRRLVFPL